MDYQGPPIPVQQFCVRQASSSSVPGRYFMAFNDQEAWVYNEKDYKFLSMIVPKCPPSLFPLF